MTTPLLVNLDTAPTIAGVLTNDLTGDPLDLTTASFVYLQLRRADDRRFLVNALCDIVDAAAGEVEYELQTEDLDFTGDCKLRFLVIWSDARRQHTVPALDVTIEAQ